MLVYSFIAGLFTGAFFGMLLLSLLVAGKQNEYTDTVGNRLKAKHAVVDQEGEEVFKKIALSLTD